MTSISPISFRGVGGESAGSIAYRNNKPEQPTETKPINFRGNGSESTGSIAYTRNNKPEQPVETDTVNFHGNGSESTGSIAHKDKPTECPNCGTQLSFKGKYNNEDKKGVSAVGVIASLAALTAATIIGLGYAHKTGQFTKLGDNWFGQAMKKLEPAGQKCHEWCGAVKKTGLEWWGKLKGSSKKD